MKFKSNDYENIFKISKGFTVIEIMLATAIFSLVVLGFTRGFSYFAANSKRVERQTDVINEINSTLYSISYDIRMAKSPNEDAVIAEEHFPVRIEDNGRELIIFKLAEGNRMVRVVYRLDNGNLISESSLSINNSMPYVFPVDNEENRRLLLRNVEDRQIFIDESDDKVIPDLEGRVNNVRKILVEITVNDEESGIQESSSMTVISRSR